ncbi:unnamed protein product [Hyaloperonospora brassicae]|nr:unnamed protein product [Hyaloperonospora brassicae]
MVGTTPHEQLTQAYLLMDLGLLVTPSCPGVKSELSFVPGSIAAQNRGRSAARSEQKRESGDEVKSDMPSGKRPRTHETEPVRRPGATQRGLLTREERRLRKPRSSPLLPRRDAATSKMCSDALARSIILVLNKVQSPPAEEDTQADTFDDRVGDFEKCDCCVN